MDLLSQLADDPRVTVRRTGLPDPNGSCVVYWMQRAQRALDNPALDVAVEVGNALHKPVVVFLAPVPLRSANLRAYQFLMEGIPDIEEQLRKRRIGFVLRKFPDHSLARFCEEVKAALVIGDENPLRATESWRQRAARKLRVPLWTVDADVVVPSKLVDKAQYAARFIRPRLKAQFKEFLVPSANPKARTLWRKPRNVVVLPSYDHLTDGWKIDRRVSPATTFRGGAREAQRRLKHFVKNQLSDYPAQRNHPELDGTSQLSPYLHFGHISPITIALAVKKADVPRAAKDAFLDQLIIWRELSVNFVRFQPDYDTFECAEPWAHRTLARHSKDPRPVTYSERQLENAETYDDLWNAAQRQMVDTGWMHNYMRMYWGKKILEWSPSPARAYAVAVRLNDKYELDGRDPNGYAGIAWALVGKFDRPWFERPIFGQIRYMSGKSTSQKFDSKLYIRRQLQHAA